MIKQNRRSFFKLTGSMAILPATLSEPSMAMASAPAKSKKSSGRMAVGDKSLSGAFAALPFDSTADDISLAKGFEWYAVAKMGDVINKEGQKFGDCCDFTSVWEGQSSDQMFIWVNHEYIVHNVLYGKLLAPTDKTKEQIDHERSLVGGSYLELKKNSKTKKWELVGDSEKAFRLDGTTKIPLVGPAGGREVTGTMGNCGGGSTPWGTVLSGEENVSTYYHEPDGYGWGNFYPSSKLDYGWVVEVDLQNKSARKLTAMGRFAHEGATVVAKKGKKVVVYLGDDARGECFYKFVSKELFSGDPKKDRDLLVEGDLYVADLAKGVWVHLNPSNPLLANDKEGRFKTLADICNQTRDAAKVVGGTPLNRPEDVKIDPSNGDVYFTLTNNSKAGDFHGQVVLLTEKDADHTSLSFEYKTYLTGGLGSGVSCPDNIVFGPGGHLWVCTDISGETMGKGVHTRFPRNSVFRMEDAANGTALARHFLQAPHGAEITGPSFTKDGKTFFMSIQHPGEDSFENGNTNYTSHWPEGGNASPKSTLIAVREKGSSFK